MVPRQDDERADAGADGLNFALVGASCVAAQGTVHWTRTAMVQQQLAGMRGEKPLGMLAQTASIWRGEGVRGLYRGASAAALREATYSSLRFGLYEPLKVALDTSGGRRSSRCGRRSPLDSSPARARLPSRHPRTCS